MTSKINYKAIFIIPFFFLITGDVYSFENSIGIKFKVIPPGKFLMGSPGDQPGHKPDEPLHTVIISKPFMIASTETTQSQWMNLMDYNPSASTNRCRQCPVESVSWNQVNDFIKKLNIKESTNKYRLPTEAEWEYACRAGTDTAFYTGEISAENCEFDPALDEAGWYCGNSGVKHPFYNLRPGRVGLKRPNSFGLFDMHGNVMEWCLDSTDWNNILSRRTGADITLYVNNIENPVGKKGTKKIFRGGSFLHSSIMARSSSRFFFNPKAKRSYIGFRVVRDLR